MWNSDGAWRVYNSLTSLESWSERVTSPISCMSLSFCWSSISVWWVWYATSFLNCSFSSIVLFVFCRPRGNNNQHEGEMRIWVRMLDLKLNITVSKFTMRGRTEWSCSSIILVISFLVSSTRVWISFFSRSFSCTETLSTSLIASAWSLCSLRSWSFNLHEKSRTGFRTSRGHLVSTWTLKFPKMSPLAVTLVMESATKIAHKVNQKVPPT